MKFNTKEDIDTNRLERFRKERGMKNSTRRAVVVAHFLSRDRHYSVEELYQEIKRIEPGIGYSTIYRTLKLLNRCGLASQCDFADGRQRFEPCHSTKHHDHLICRKCGRIIEFKNDDIEKLQESVARRHQFQVESHQLKLFGICASCQTKTG